MRKRRKKNPKQGQERTNEDKEGKTERGEKISYENKEVKRRKKKNEGKEQEKRKRQRDMKTTIRQRK